MSLRSNLGVCKSVRSQDPHLDTLLEPCLHVAVDCLKPAEVQLQVAANLNAVHVGRGGGREHCDL